MTNQDHNAAADVDDTTAASPQRQAHTPGPWSLNERLEGHVFAGDQLVAGCMGYSRNFHESDLRAQQLANAHLIAAAPEMRDAAEMLWVVLANVSGGDWTKQSHDWRDAAARWRDNYFAALAKSEGKP